MIPALTTAGVEWVDAVNYVVGGCWDALTPDTANKFSGEYLNILKPFEWLIYGAYKTMDDRGLEYKGFEEYATFEQVYNTYVENVKSLLRARRS